MPDASLGLGSEPDCDSDCPRDGVLLRRGELASISVDGMADDEEVGCCADWVAMGCEEGVAQGLALEPRGPEVPNLYIVL